MKTHKLNLGCGTETRPGWINLDRIELQGVDVVHNIEQLPLPFADQEFDEILCQDVLEHVEYVPILRDLYRILKPGGAITIRVPHFTSQHNFIDPTHKKMFSINTFDFFVRGSFEQEGRSYYFDFSFAKRRAARIIFDHSSLIFFLNGLAERVVNSSMRMQRIYEATFFCRLFPALNILVTLEK